MGHTGPEESWKLTGKRGGAGPGGAISGLSDPRAGLIEPKTEEEAIERMERAAAVIKTAGKLMLAKEAAQGAGGRRA